MPTLTITRGLPGSGKTTRARAWVAEDPATRARVNRDDLRAQLHDGAWKGPDTERQVIATRDATIGALLKRGVDVVCDDTSLPQRTARDLRRLATLAGAGFGVWDLTDVPLETCIARDAARERMVGEQVIRDMHRRYLAGRKYPLPWPENPESTAGAPAPYVPRPGAQRAILVDLDGTMCLHNGRGPYDESRVGEDLPNGPVLAAVCAMAGTGHRVIFMSGRTEGCRVATEKWLDEHYLFAYESLWMRAVGDQRRDAVVKAELFDRYVRDRYDVRCVFDDRNQVVSMWRSLGLTVFQVADGDF